MGHYDDCYAQDEERRRQRKAQENLVELARLEANPPRRPLPYEDYHTYKLYTLIDDLTARIVVLESALATKPKVKKT